MDNKVIVSQIKLVDGRKLGQLTINREKALNALDFDVVEGLIEQLSHWLEDDSVVAVWLEGAGERAFCAGGDVVSMHHAMRDAPRVIPQSVTDFFTLEYTLDYLIHTYTKPIFVWASGIVMGGGLGLLAGASHRLVTQTSRIAMPEVTIGLYPDVGASYFLHNMPGKAGRFLGMTGANINGTDALYVKLADHFVNQDCKTHLLDALKAASWHAAAEDNFEVATNICIQFEKISETLKPEPNVEPHQILIDDLFDETDMNVIYQHIANLVDSEHPWLQKAANTFLKGSPLTISLVQEQLNRSEGMNLIDCFKMELGLSCRCSEYGEFEEGVRALLVDKDNQPNWRFKSVDQVPESLIQCFFTSPWGDVHPLDDLQE